MNLAEERTAVEQSKETGDDEREKRRAQIFGIFLNIIIRRKERVWRDQSHVYDL